MSDRGDVALQRQIAALETDLFFAVKIQDTLKRSGFQVRIVRNGMEFRTLLLDGNYALALVNTAARGVDWRAAVASAREAGVPVIAYGPHVDIETQTAARTAGASRVIANSRLTDLPSIVERMLSKLSKGAPSSEKENTGSSEVSFDEEGASGGQTR